MKNRFVVAAAWFVEYNSFRTGNMAATLSPATRYGWVVHAMDGEGVECTFEQYHTTNESQKARKFTSPINTSAPSLAPSEVDELCANLKKKQRFRFLKAILRLGQRKGKHTMSIQQIDDSASHGTDSTAPDSSSDSDSTTGSELHTKEWPSEKPLIEERLLGTGIITSTDEFELVPDYVSKEMEGLFDINDKKTFDEQHEGKVAHVKTGVWQVQCFDDDGSTQEPFYIVTGVAMDDRVDTKKLRRAIFAGNDSAKTTKGNNKRRPKLGLAPTEIGEALTGFQSGTMMPICHSVDMQLFLEETITDQRTNPQHRILCGSGIFGKCLSIPTDKFVRIAESNPCGMKSCSLIQKKTKVAE